MHEHDQLPAWAEDDPSRTGVPAGRLALEPADITHETFFGGELLRVCPGGRDPGADTAVLTAVMQCRPFDDAPAAPLVSVQPTATSLKASRHISCATVASMAASS